MKRIIDIPEEMYLDMLRPNINYGYILDHYKYAIATALRLSESNNKELTYAEVETWANEHGLVLWSEDMSEKALEALKKIRDKEE